MSDDCRTQVCLTLERGNPKHVWLSAGDAAVLAHTRGSININGKRHIVDRAEINFNFEGDVGRTVLVLHAREAR